MTWFKVDDNLAVHAKTVHAGNAAMGLWVRAGAWCAAHGTEGKVPTHVVKLLGTVGQAKQLVEAGLWLKEDAGYVFHEWLHYQPTRAEVAAERALVSERKAKAGRLGGIASGVARRKHEGSSDEADIKQNGEAEVKQEGSRSKPLPDPSLPEEPSRRFASVKDSSDLDLDPALHVRPCGKVDNQVAS